MYACLEIEYRCTLPAPKLKHFARQLQHEVSNVCLEIKTNKNEKKTKKTKQKTTTTPPSKKNPQFAKKTHHANIQIQRLVRKWIICLRQTPHLETNACWAVRM